MSENIEQNAASKEKAAVRTPGATTKSITSSAKTKKPHEEQERTWIKQVTNDLENIKLTIIEQALDIDLCDRNLCEK